MRLEKFESAGRKPLGTGKDKRVFVNPKNEGRVISETGEGMNKEDTIRQLKGRYYLTKIAHLLLPKNIPDVHQAGESVEGKQTVDAERIPHTPAHARLQEECPDIGSVWEQLRKEIGREKKELESELQRVGLDFDPYVGNYTKDEKGNVYYLETFKPWIIQHHANPKEIKLLFDEEKLRGAIDGIPDKAVRGKCERYLERILALAKEEKQKLQDDY